MLLKINMATVITRPRVQPESYVGRRVPTFAELAQYQVPPREKPIKREAIVFYDSFEGSFLRQAADVMRDKAVEMQIKRVWNDLIWRFCRY